MWLSEAADKSASSAAASKTDARLCPMFPASFQTLQNPAELRAAAERLYRKCRGRHFRNNSENNFRRIDKVCMASRFELLARQRLSRQNTRSCAIFALFVEPV
jgi:hypothetical protein